MGATTLQTGARRGKWGLVVVRTIGGSIDRAFKITEAEYAALALPDAGAPPGVTKLEWESGLAQAIGKDYDSGDIETLRDGSVRVKIGERTANSVLIESYMVLKPGEFTGTPPLISVDPVVLAGLDLSRTALTAIDSITAGVVTWR